MRTIVAVPEFVVDSPAPFLFPLISKTEIPAISIV